MFSRIRHYEPARSPPRRTALRPRTPGPARRAHRDGVRRDVRVQLHGPHPVDGEVRVPRRPRCARRGAGDQRCRIGDRRARHRVGRASDAPVARRRDRRVRVADRGVGGDAGAHRLRDHLAPARRGVVGVQRRRPDGPPARHRSRVPGPGDEPVRHRVVGHHADRLDPHGRHRRGGVAARRHSPSVRRPRSSPARSCCGCDGGYPPKQRPRSGPGTVHPVGLESINGPADLRALDAEQLRARSRPRSAPR